MNNPLSNCLVLLAEDDEITRESWSKILSRFTREVRCAENGHIALVMIEAQKPDLVITDLEMPVMDGMRLTSIIKERFSDVPVIVATAFDDEAHQVPEADAFLTKPIDKEELKATMAAVMQKSSLV